MLDTSDLMLDTSIVSNMLVRHLYVSNMLVRHLYVSNMCVKHFGCASSQKNYSRYLNSW